MLFCRDTLRKALNEKIVLGAPDIAHHIRAPIFYDIL